MTVADNLRMRWHGAPVWLWGVGGTLTTVGIVYVWRKRKGSSVSSPTVDTTGVPDEGTGNGASSGSGAPFPLFGNYQPPTSEGLDTAGLLKQISDAVTTVTDAVKSIPSELPIPTPASVPVNAPVDTPKAPSPIPASISVPPPVAAYSPVMTPPGYVSTPIVAQGQTIGENLTDTSVPQQPTASWQQAIGLSPAVGGEVATPIIAQGQTVGESFVGSSSGQPAPYNVIDNPPPASDVVYSEFGPLTVPQFITRFGRQPSAQDFVPR